MIVHLLFEAWKGDEPEVIGVYASDEAVDAYIVKATATEDNYTAQHRTFHVKTFEVQGGDRGQI